MNKHLIDIPSIMGSCKGPDVVSHRSEHHVFGGHNNHPLLGGKAPAVVGPDFPLATAAQRILWAKCMNAGQVCVNV
ncbi:MAG TPA: aldehyde dehydrogenase family protein, partial [Cyanobium sp.]|nr:aldehyde dehydrogenase family protein [Cyanobium sp.]